MLLLLLSVVGVTAQLCADSCPPPPPGQVVIGSTCSSNGDLCVAGICAGTDYACIANSDCACGCLYAANATKRQQNSVTAIGCHPTCTVHADCSDPQPQNQCLQRDCWDGTCMNVPALYCNDFDSCTLDSCEPAANGTATCVHTPIDACCQQASDCPDIGEACTRVECQNFNVTSGRGECVNVTIAYPCCAADDDCVSPSNPCRLSTCLVNETMCDLANEMDKNCSAVDTDNDRCTAPICNATAGGACQLLQLSDDLCPGACCFPNGTCDDNDMQDEMWCVFDGGSFIGVNTTCEPELCRTNEPTSFPTNEPSPHPTNEPTGNPTNEPSPHPTNEPTEKPTSKPTGNPTSEPSPHPTNEPTEKPTSEPTGKPTSEPTEKPTSKPTGNPTNAPSPHPTNEPTEKPTSEPTGKPTNEPSPHPTNEAECNDDIDCPVVDKCHIPECEDYMCMQAPIICNDNDPCTSETCDPWTGQCLYMRDFSCCRTPTDCFDSGHPCTEPLCIKVNESDVSGTCGELNKPNCCTDNMQCNLNGTMCLERICNHLTYTCQTIGLVDCGEDGDADLCTQLVCNNATGQCDEAVLPPDECPGACCFDDGSCDEMDELWCDVDDGSFNGINTTCEKTMCHNTPTPAPTRTPPTDCSCDAFELSLENITVACTDDVCNEVTATVVCTNLNAVGVCPPYAFSVRSGLFVGTPPKLLTITEGENTSCIHNAQNVDCTSLSFGPGSMALFQATMTFNASFNGDSIMLDVVKLIANTTTNETCFGNTARTFVDLDTCAMAPTPAPSSECSCDAFELSLENITVACTDDVCNEVTANVVLTNLNTPDMCPPSAFYAENTLLIDTPTKLFTITEGENTSCASAEGIVQCTSLSIDAVSTVIFQATMTFNASFNGESVEFRLIKAIFNTTTDETCSAKGTRAFVDLDTCAMTPTSRPTPQPTSRPTPQPTPRPTPVPTSWPHCPPLDECYILGGECYPMEVTCPPGHRSKVGPCDASTMITEIHHEHASDQWCHCCIPCADLECPGHPAVACDYFGPCSDYANEPIGEPEERVCELAPILPCWADQDCDCSCSPYEGVPLACQPRLPPPCSSCQAPACECTRACGREGTCACHVVDAQQHVVGTCAEFGDVPSTHQQVCACEEPLACCFTDVVPAQACQLLEPLACARLGGVPSASTVCVDDVTCPRSCTEQCHCTTHATGSIARPPDLCRLSTCRAGVCADDFKMDCPKQACHDSCADRSPRRNCRRKQHDVFASDHEIDLLDDTCSGINYETGVPFDDGYCECWHKGAPSSCDVKNAYCACTPQV